MPFRVGDKVRFTDRCPRGWFFGPFTEFKTGTVRTVNGESVRTVNVDGRGDSWGYINSNDQLELIEEVPRKVFYTIIYKSLVEPGTMISAGFESEQRAMECKDEKIEHETFVAMKKITLSNL